MGAGKATLWASGAIIALLSGIFAFEGLAGMSILSGNVSARLLILLIGIFILALETFAENFKGVKKMNPAEWIATGVIVLGAISLLYEIFMGEVLAVLSPVNSLLYGAVAVLLLIEVFTNMLDARKSKSRR